MVFPCNRPLCRTDHEKQNANRRPQRNHKQQHFQDNLSCGKMTLIFRHGSGWVKVKLRGCRVGSDWKHMSVQLGSELGASVLFWLSGSIDTSCIKPGLKEPDRAFDTEPFRATQWRRLLFGGLGFFFLFDWCWLMWRRCGKEQQNQDGGARLICFTGDLFTLWNRIRSRNSV